MLPVRAFRIFLLCVLAGASAGCALLDTTNDIEITVVPDESVYDRSASTKVRLRLHNSGATTVLFNTCGKQRFERLDKGRLTDTWTRERSCECLCEFRLKPGEVKEMATSFTEMRSMAGELETASEISYRFLPVMYFKEDAWRLVDRGTIRVKAFRFVR